ncbi:N-acetylneuraminic acid mutarotase [Crossiella equi]|uniref:N-acetylneuraminic acid mutarotase n=1 Tax=Crossiella equi TaxID=130796 RepID=A0ABS5A7L4_9PSEU|nr:kelch repeat-containing protein [Crossiella equi]MBP2472296.1 N-acetylneuraminic acid mutarotase [Crossiella equi]
MRTSEWSQRAALPEARAEVGVAALGGRVHVLGGTVVTDGPPRWASTLNTAYDPGTDTWQQLAPLPIPLSHTGVAELDGRLYAVGGFQEPVHLHPQRLACAYDPATDRWTELPPLPQATGSVAVAAVAGQLHVLGGRTSERVVRLDTGPGGPELSAGLGTVRTHQVFQPSTNQWRTAAPLPGPARDHQGIAVLAGRIHVFGGRSEDINDNLTRHDVYDPGTDTWTEAAPLPAPRSSGACTVLDGRILYAGGECSDRGTSGGTPAYTTTYAYDPAAAAWTELAPLPAPRHAFGAATVDGVAYFAGGAPTCGGGASTELFALS